MPFQNDILGGTSAQGGDYDIEKSLLFEYSDSSKLGKDFPGPASPGGGTFSSNQIMTLSCWLKFGPANDFYTDTTHIPYRTIVSFGGSGGTFSIGLHMQDYNPPSGGSDVALAIKSVDSGGSAYFNLISEGLLRDYNAWYHLVVQLDSTQSTEADRYSAWLNNVKIEEWSQVDPPAHNEQMYINGNYMQTFRIGCGYNQSGNSAYWDGYIAELYYLDGQAKIPSDFAEEDLITGQWKAIAYDGTYGNNGGYYKLGADNVLDTTFADSSESFKSLYFDGTDDYIELPSGLQGSGAGNAFSIAFWIYLNEATGQIYSQYPDATATGRFTISPSGSDGSIKLAASISGGATSHETAENLNLAQWYHCVLTRDGGTYKWYINGSESGTTTTGGNTDQLSSSSPRIVSRNLNPGFCSVRYAQFATWNIELSSSDVTGLYASGSKIANWKTSYSSGMETYYTFGNTIVNLGDVDTAAKTFDRSGNGYDGTNQGTFTYNPRYGHPITSYTGYARNTRSQKKIGQSSISFHAASGSYIDIPPSAGFEFGSSDWTMECWVRLSTTAGQQGMLVQGLEADRGWRMLSWHDSSGFTSGRDVTSGTNDFNINMGTTSGISADTWYHLAVVRNGGTITLYLDGSSVGTPVTGVTGDFNTDTDSSILTIGGQYNNGGTREEFFGGWLDEIRISNTARYTGSFTPSTSAFTEDANTMLLIHSDWAGGMGADESGNGHDLEPSNLTVNASVLDSPTNNFCVMNYLSYPRTGNNTYQQTRWSEGNLRVKQLSGAGANWYTASFPIAGGTGKWYWEFVDIRYYDLGVFGGTYPIPWGQGLTPITFANDTKGRTGYNNDLGSGYQWKYVKSNNNVGTSAGYTGGNSAENKRVPSNSGIFKHCYDSDNGKFYWGGDLGWMTSDSTSEGTLDTSAEPTSTNFLWGSGIGVGDISPYIVIPTWQNARSGDTEALLGYHSYNFGQDSSFQGLMTPNGYSDANGYGDFHYPVPTGYKALCAKNFPDPAVKKSTEAFNAVKWTGDASTRSITGVGFQPDVVWIKNASEDSTYHYLADVIRGFDSGWAEALMPDRQDAQVDYANGLSSFDSDGFTIGSLTDINSNTKTIASWSWKAGGAGSANTDGTINSTVSANVDAGFSIVQYVGNDTSGATVGHGLSEAPHLIIIKKKDGSADFVVYSEPVGNTAGLALNGGGAQYTFSGYFNDTSPTASVFSLGNNTDVNDGDNTYIAYCFHIVPGFSAIGGYVGWGNSYYQTSGSTLGLGSGGPFIPTTFKPAFVLIKNKEASGAWLMKDKIRTKKHNVADGTLRANLSDDQNTNTDNYIDLVSNGFKLRGDSTEFNGNDQKYIYLAMAESPLKYTTAR